MIAKNLAVLEAVGVAVTEAAPPEVENTQVNLNVSLTVLLATFLETNATPLMLVFAVIIVKNVTGAGQKEVIGTIRTLTADVNQSMKLNSLNRR